MSTLKGNVRRNKLGLQGTQSSGYAHFWNTYLNWHEVVMCWQIQVTKLFFACLRIHKFTGPGMELTKKSFYNITSMVTRKRWHHSRSQTCNPFGQRRRLASACWLFYNNCLSFYSCQKVLLFKLVFFPDIHIANTLRLKTVIAR